MPLTAPISLAPIDPNAGQISTGAYHDIFGDDERKSLDSGHGTVLSSGMSVELEYAAQTSPTASPNHAIDTAETLPRSRLPRFIKFLPSHLDQDDLRYLQARGCFTFLSADLCKTIMRRYAEFIHPLVPVIDLEEFVAALFSDVEKKISPLLYHAVMCAGLAAVDVQTILSHGFESKVAARKQCYTRAKVLFDMDVETDRLVTCQASILLSSWASYEHSRDPFYWMGVAISEACTLRIDKPGSNTNLPKKDQVLRQRIWWTLILRECDICLTLGKPPRISLYRSPLPQHDIFGNTASLSHYSHLPETGKLRRDPWIQRRLEMAYIEKAKLALVIYQILKLSSSNDDVASGQKSRNARIWQLESELKDWRLQLPMELTSYDAALNLFEGADRSLQMTMSTLLLTQLMAVVMLHRSEASATNWPKSSQIGGDWFDDIEALDAQGHTRSIRQAAHEITTIHETLHEQQLTGSLPPTCVATICTAVFVHLLDARSTEGPIREAALKHLDTCLTILPELGQVNEAANDIARLIVPAVQAVRASSAPATRKENATSPTRPTGLNRPQYTNGASLDTPSFMDGVMPDQGPIVNGTLSPWDLFGSALEFGGQDPFFGIEGIFDPE
ncbi:hypothetical protein FOPE_02510 [Fonsecaea pedrosoi]|nr:hypothetical protein FOPE_02510 [Fonsecaea pedrosoi]